MTLTFPLPPDVTYEMLYPEFWLKRYADADKLLHTPETIAVFNRRVYEILHIPDVLSLPDALSSEEIMEQIQGYFRLANKIRYGGNTQSLNREYFENLFRNASPELPDEVRVRFGLAIQRTNVRAFPSGDLIMAEPFDFAFDLAQETTIDVGWPVAALVSSRDEQWIFCLTPLYWGWVAAHDIAIGSRQQVQNYTETESFLRTTANRGLVALETGGGVTPQMGTRLPLLDETEKLYQVNVPVRDNNSRLEFACGYIYKQANEFHIGNLPCTVTNLFQQAFSLTGEAYSWGGSRLGVFGRDCSQFIKDVYATTGLILPRNGDQQGRVGKLRVKFPEGISDQERARLIVEHGKPGDVLVIPTHVMLYLGHIDGKPYIIHDVTAGQNRIIVSDMTLGENTGRGTLLSRLDIMVGVE